MVGDDTSSVTGKNIEMLKFEYNLLKEENLKNYDMSYRIMAFLIPASIAFLTWMAQKDSPTFFQLISTAIASVAGLYIAYKIDGRLTYANRKRVAQMNLIEKRFKLWNHRIFDKSGEIPSDLRNEINEMTKDYKGCFNTKVHEYFRYYIWAFGFAWFLLIFGSPLFQLAKTAIF
jgi:hypothetical protein